MEGPRTLKFRVHTITLSEPVENKQGFCSKLELDRAALLLTRFLGGGQVNQVMKKVETPQLNKTWPIKVL